MPRREAPAAVDKASPRDDPTRNPLHPRSHADDSAAARAARRSSPTISGTLGPPGAQPVRAPRSRAVARGRPQPQGDAAQVDEKRLHEVAEDPGYLTATAACCPPTTPISPHPRRAGDGLGADDLIAYFCAEFGFHESLPIYSGGLGILAGDHCKAASDVRLPFVGVGPALPPGLLRPDHRRRGQPAREYPDSDFDDLPIAPARDARRQRGPRHGRSSGARRRGARCGRRTVGHVRLYLLDTDLPENSERDRAITHRLYGGDRSTRIEQEIVLGVGGVRALAALGTQAHGLAHQRRATRRSSCSSAARC